MDLALILLKTPAKKILVILVAVYSSNKAAHKEEIRTFLASIKPAP